MSFSDKINGSISIGMYLANQQGGMLDKLRDKKALKATELAINNSISANKAANQARIKSDEKFKEAKEIGNITDVPDEVVVDVERENMHAADAAEKLTEEQISARGIANEAQQKYAELAKKRFFENPTQKGLQQYQGSMKVLRDYDQAWGDFAADKVMQEYQARKKAAQKYMLRLKGYGQ